jgi:GNAT superfamily N-acetyltransferase
VQCSINPPGANPARTVFSGGNVRTLFAREREKVADHLLRLSPADRKRRFFGQVSDDHAAAYTKKLFVPGVTVLGCFVHGALRGIGELHRQQPSAIAEVAITVEADFQGCGIGTDLLRRLVGIARNRRIKTLNCFCLLDNPRAQKIARRLGGALHRIDGGIEAEIAQPWPSYLSLLSEAHANGQGVLHAWWLHPVENALRARSVAQQGFFGKQPRDDLGREANRFSG